MKSARSVSSSKSKRWETVHPNPYEPWHVEQFARLKNLGVVLARVHWVPSEMEIQGTGIRLEQERNSRQDINMNRRLNR